MNPGPCRLEGKVALVTGSSSGAGVEIARAFARRGVHVAVHCRANVAAAQQIVEQIREEGHEATAFCADLGLPCETRRLAAEVKGQLGAISILVNNAPEHRFSS